MKEFLMAVMVLFMASPVFAQVAPAPDSADSNTRISKPNDVCWIDTDCPGDEVCQSEVCVDPRAGLPQALPSSEGQALSR